MAIIKETLTSLEVDMINNALDSLSDQWKESLDILEDLLKFGEHEGKCDNSGEEDTKSCEQHIAAFNVRVQRSQEFLRRFRGENDPPP